MNPPFNFIVIGPEDSGTNWLTWIVNQHPDVNHCKHYSYPSHRGKERHYLDLKNVSDDYKVLIVTREKWMTKVGQMRVGYAYFDPIPSDPDEANSVILKQIENTNKEYFFVSYETLVTWKGLYLKQLFKTMGLNPKVYNYAKVPYKDGNAKYGQQLLTQEVIDKAQELKMQEAEMDTGRQKLR